ncbi:MAG: methyltransferase domain-containing protein [Candidatus Dormibacteraeota bacterium]|nr:methyltransferase domain-containing protein [Candidatus Dormibacteraeota bacterium]MBV8445580.1 methyltransferase domain-containing protein [Candidatus Dormibacteraeota bacterium]
MSDTTHQDRERALSFGGVAETYELGRPSYPPELIDDLLALQPRSVLDVGTGTGKAGRLFAARGVSLIGVEPDPRMAELARRHGYPVEEATFESWDPRGRVFDLIVSGQAWHWVDPAGGIPKAASLLSPGGHLAAFWNIGSHDGAVRARLAAVYERLAPQIAASTTALGVRDKSDPARAQLIAEHPGFAQVELRSYLWDQVYTRDQWLLYLQSHSDHVLLPPETRSAVLGEVGAVIDTLGGSLAYHYTTVLILASRGAA